MFLFGLTCSFRMDIMWVILTCHWCHRKKVREGAAVAGWDTLEPDVYRWGEGHFSLRTQKQKRLRSLEA